MYPWHNERVLVTGATGFIGTHLVQALTGLGATVVGVTTKQSSGDTVTCDVKDFSALGELFKKHTFTMCYHLAGLAQVETGQLSPHPTFETNIIGALHILECARIFHTGKVILASTSHVYGENKVPYREHYAPKPTRPYETSKASIDLLAMSYARTYQVPVYIARFVNIYGPGDLNFTRLIPKTIRSVLSGSPPEMWGGQAIRDYLYIDDAVDAYVKLGEVKADGTRKEQIFNFGSSNLCSVKDIIGCVIKHSGVSVAINKIPDLRENEISIQYVSWAKARKLLKWKPKVDIEKGMKQTVEWYKTNLP